MKSLKKIILGMVFVLGTATSFGFATTISTFKVVDVSMVTVILSCGGNAYYDNSNMSLADEFETVGYLEYFFCEGGSSVMWTIG